METALLYDRLQFTVTVTFHYLGLQVGVVWFVIGLVLIIAYQVYAHRVFWGKVPIMEQRADRLEVGRTP